MRWIRKGDAPQSFRRWAASGSAEWQPQWNELQNPQKGELRTALLREQGDLCCYCNCRIVDESLKCHIEHVVPGRKADDPLALDYENMAMSCTTPGQCGNGKGNWYDPGSWVSPHDATCEGRFTFYDDGSIEAADPEDLAAKTTQQRLSLDRRGLVAARGAAIAGFLQGLGTLTPDDLEAISDALQHPDALGQLEPFVVAVQQSLKRLL